MTTLAHDTPSRPHISLRMRARLAMRWVRKRPFRAAIFSILFLLALFIVAGAIVFRLIAGGTVYFLQSDFSHESNCSVAWSSDGTRLAVNLSSGPNNLRVYTWNSLGTISAAGYPKDLSNVQWSPDGGYLSGIDHNAAAEVRLSMLRTDDFTVVNSIPLDLATTLFRLYCWDAPHQVTILGEPGAGEEGKVSKGEPGALPRFAHAIPIGMPPFDQLNGSAREFSAAFCKVMFCKTGNDNILRAVVVTSKGISVYDQGKAPRLDLFPQPYASGQMFYSLSSDGSRLASFAQRKDDKAIEIEILDIAAGRKLHTMTLPESLLQGMKPFMQMAIYGGGGRRSTQDLSIHTMAFSRDGTRLGVSIMLTDSDRGAVGCLFTWWDTRTGALLASKIQWCVPSVYILSNYSDWSQTPPFGTIAWTPELDKVTFGYEFQAIIYGNQVATRTVLHIITAPPAALAPAK